MHHSCSAPNHQPFRHVQLSTAPRTSGPRTPSSERGFFVALPRRQPERATLSQRLLGDGIEPDPRFTLANERTFLAWIRTALALLAGGIAVEAFTADVFPDQVRTLLAVVLLLLGVLLSAGAAVRWYKVERSLRHQAPLPLPLIAPLLGAGGAMVSGALIVFVIRN
jgi:putative membrane protein